MNRIEAILSHPEFNRRLNLTNELEESRIFCCHSISHLLDVARIAYILVLEQQLSYPKEMIYAMGLLHDIGKHEQYSRGIHHEKASARCAPRILTDAGFDEEEIQQISEAILAHRRLETEDKTSLKWILYKADKMSRNCFACEAGRKCNWSQMNKSLYEWTY